MKKISSIILIIFFPSYFLFGQCLPERHSATWYDGWISCEISTSPNPERKTHWVMYDLEQDYYLYEMHIWNMNAPDIIDYGLKNVYVDLSSDGTNWVEYGQFIFSQAPGENSFEGQEEVDFGGEKARYVLISSIDNYGGTCYGLSEVKIRARETCPLNYVAWIGDDGDWDIASNWCNDQIPTALDSVWIPPKKNINIPSAFVAEVLWLDVSESSSINIEGDLNISID